MGGRDAVVVHQQDLLSTHLSSHGLKLLLEAIDESGYRNRVFIGVGLQSTAESCDDLARNPQLFAIDVPSGFLGVAPVAPAGMCQIVGKCVSGPITARSFDLTQMTELLKSFSTLHLKIDELGTLTNIVEASIAFRTANCGTVLSSGIWDVEGFVADLAVGLDARQVELGPPCSTLELCETHTWLCRYQHFLRI